MLKKLCKAPSCNRTAAPGHKYCTLHLYKEREEEERKNSFFGNPQYASQWPELYASTRWKEMSQLQLKQHPYCAYCGAKADQVDHVMEHRGNLDLFFNEDNLQSLCQHCHMLKTKKEIASRQRERIKEYKMRKRYNIPFDSKR